MTRFRMISTAVLGSLLALLFSHSAQGADTRTFWFGDIKTPLRMSEEETDVLVRFASAALLSGKAEAEGANLPQD